MILYDMKKLIVFLCVQYFVSFGISQNVLEIPYEATALTEEQFQLNAGKEKVSDWFKIYKWHIYNSNICSTIPVLFLSCSTM